MDALRIDVETSVPYQPQEKYLDLRERVEAACNTITHLKPHGLQVEDKPSEKDKQEARKLVQDYASNTEQTKRAPKKRLSDLTPASVRYVAAILDNFGHKVATDAAEIRNLVTNKLIGETENPDPRVRLKAYELLGKIGDVGLFTEKSEVTITHQTSDELRDKLRRKLEKVINPQDNHEAKPLMLDGECIDIDKELGREAVARHLESKLE